MFPAIRDPSELNVRIKNLARDVYLCVKTDDQGAHTFSTKTLNSEADPEVDFSLYFYTSAEAGETKLVLPVHQATKVCFSMTDDNQLVLSALTQSNEVDEAVENPLQFSVADNRFFYIKKSGSNDALEAMNGKQSNYFLSVNDSNTIVLKEVADSNYPEDTLFFIQELDNK